MKNTINENKDFQARGVFLTGMTDLGNELLYFYPEVKIGEKINHDLCLKTMPMACEDGDMLITHIGDLLAVTVTRLIPCFEKNNHKKETFAALGMLIPLDTNPIPYYKMLVNLLNRFERDGNLNKEALVNCVPKLYKKINQKLM